MQPKTIKNGFDNVHMQFGFCEAPPYTICLVIWVAKLDLSHLLQSNKNQTYRGRWERFLVSF